MEYPEDYKIAIELAIEHEGGKSNHANDSGGATNMGITAVALADFCRRKNKAWTVETLTKPQALEFYFLEYWKPLRLSEFPSQDLKNVVFCTAINRDDSHGNFVTIKTLQRVLGVTVDGWIGPKTIAALNKADPAKTLEDFCAAIKNAYVTIAQQWYVRDGGLWIRCEPTFPGATQKNQVFLKGWLRRINSFRLP